MNGFRLRVSDKLFKYLAFRALTTALSLIAFPLSFTGNRKEITTLKFSL